MAILWSYIGYFWDHDVLSGKVDVWTQLRTSCLVYFNVVQCINMVILTTRLEVSEVGLCDQQKVEISQKLECCKVGILSWSSREENRDINLAGGGL